MKSTIRISPQMAIILVCTICSLCWAGFDILHDDGMVGVTKHGPNPYGCICHGDGAPTDSVVVHITGPETVKTNTTNIYTLTMSGGPAIKGGLDIAAANGSLYPLDSTVQRMENSSLQYELTHMFPKPFQSGSVSWQFSYQAPANPGRDTLWSVGNSVNGDDQPTGDQFNFGVDFPLTIIDSLGAGQFRVNNLWNLVCVPVTVSDSSVGTLFPGAISSAFMFKNGYISAETLSTGFGYWLKFNGSQKISISGLEKTFDTISVNAGWNLIGSISSSVNVNAITSDPGSLVTSDFFGYANGYVVATTIDPGKGYWVKVNQSGKLILSTSSFLSSNRIRIISSSELPPSPPGSDNVSLSEGYSLSQNYPNPFNPSTNFEFQIANSGLVKLTVYNTLGEAVVKLLEEMKEPGTYRVHWDTNDLPSGVYLYELQSGGFIAVKKMVLLR